MWKLALALLLTASASGCASLPDNVERPRSTAFSTPEQTALGRLVQTRRAQAGTRMDSAFKLLDSEELAFTSRLALIDGAQRSLDLQYYAIHADASTEILLQRLRDAARRGVRVRLLLDDFNIVGTDAQVLMLGFEPNVDVRLFNPLPGSRGSLIGRLLGSLHDVPRIQKRMHNKLFLADSAIGITGGRNLGDAYFGSAEESNFVDLDVLAFGRIVRDMAISFDRYWNDELAYPAHSLISADELQALRKRSEARTEGEGQEALGAQAAPTAQSAAARQPPAGSTILTEVSGTATVNVGSRPLDLSSVALVWAPSVLLVDKPGKVAPGDEDVEAGETVVDGLLDLMQQAQRDVLIVTPYFVPGTQMMGVFKGMRERGIRIRVLTNSLASNDAPAAHAGYARYRKRILALGIELHEMRADQEPEGRVNGRGASQDRSIRSALGSGPGGSKSGSSQASLHTKAVMIDGRLSVIGSMNLDLRSKIQNSEVALVIRSRPLAQQAVNQVERTLSRGAYQVMLDSNRLSWRAPPGAPFPDERTEPGASTTLRLLVRVLGPLAPEEML